VKLDLPANFTVFFCFQKGKKLPQPFSIRFEGRRQVRPARTAQKKNPDPLVSLVVLSMRQVLL
jgi:hypothetical protein